MKTRTVIVSAGCRRGKSYLREGEKLGPVDWSYDFASHGWDKNQGGGHNPTCIPKEIEMLGQLETWLKEGKACEVLMYSMWEPVIDTGMYDGWPYWKPVPSFYSTTWLGGSWHAFTSINSVREARPTWD